VPWDVAGNFTKAKVEEAMMSERSCFHNLREGGIVRQIAAGITARIFPGVNVMLSVVTIEPNSASPIHSHRNEQWGVCLEGEWIRIQDGKEHRMETGDFWQTPPNVSHGGRTLGQRCDRPRYLRAAARGIQTGRSRLRQGIPGGLRG
jgi:quercetin dioxygenase-like cupin family protein